MEIKIILVVNVVPLKLKFVALAEKTVPFS